MSSKSFQNADKLRGIVSVLQFGAVGDGVTDDTAAIQAAATAAAASGKTLFFPAGNYRLLSYLTLPSNTDWLGEVGTKFYLDPTMALGPSIGGTPRAISNSGTENIRLNSIEFYSAKTGLTKAITICFQNVTSINISNCTFRTFGNSTYYAQGLIIFNSTGIHITNSVFTDCSGDGAALSNSCSQFFVSNNQFTNNGDWGFVASIGCSKGVVSGNLFYNNTSTATGVDRCTEVSFTGNIIINNEHGIRIAKFAATTEVNQDIAIAGNVIKNSQVAAISVEDTIATGLISVSGNSINGSANQGIRVIDAACVSVIGNSIYSCAAEAILFYAVTSGKETGRSTVVGNKSTTSTYGIRQITGAGTTSKITVVGNNFSECSTAVTGLLVADKIDGDSSSDYFSFSKTLGFPSAIYSATAGIGAVTPPAQVWGFLPVFFDGTLKKIPVYNA
jgi:hypothetical protein